MDIVSIILLLGFSLAAIIACAVVYRHEVSQKRRGDRQRKSIGVSKRRPVARLLRKYRSASKKKPVARLRGHSGKPRRKSASKERKKAAG